MALNVDVFYSALQQMSASESNAVWYEVLRQHFPFPQFIIAPEHDLGNIKLSLVVLEVKNGNIRRVFAFRGKPGGNSPNAFMGYAAEAASYLPRMKQVLDGRHYGMLAAGEKVAILEFAIVRDLDQVCKVVGPNLRLDTVPNVAHWNIETHAARLDQILTFIVTEIRKAP
ncbi:hypothetical protein MMC28_006298 [Mycoblastus sanguinarius]|nr:hypothetical protein [Mycoblastus sanguinarius]